MKWTAAKRAAFARRMAKARGLKRGRKKQRLRRARRVNPDLLTLVNPASIDARALAAFRRFHRTEPKKVRQVPTGGGPLIALGTIVEIVYRPTRGARRGPAFIHRFGKGHSLAASTDGRELQIVPNPTKPFRVDWHRGIVG